MQPSDVDRDSPAGAADASERYAARARVLAVKDFMVSARISEF